MTTVEVSIAANADDTLRMGASTFDASSGDGRLGNFFGSVCKNSLRFQLNVPAASTIDVSYVALVAATTLSATTVNVNFYYEDANSPAAPTSAADFDGRTLSTDVSAWNSIGSQTAGTTYNSASLNTIIQALVNEAYWAANEYVNIFVNDNSSTGSAYRSFAMMEHSTYAQPLLHVEYTAGGGGGAVGPLLRGRLVKRGILQGRLVG